jgi:hypothetical protein
MTINTHVRRTTAAAGALAAFLAMTTMSGSAASQKFYDDDPLVQDRDTEDASTMKPLEVDLFVDLTYNFIKARRGPEVRAKNVNTVDEVPDSSWFTNRIGRQTLTPADIANGPDTGSGPAAGTWTITSSKSDGVTPGFTVKDANGQLWFLKFDPPGYRAMATGTEVAVTKLMWALGYNVPENHIAYMRREQLVVGNGAKFTRLSGKKRPMELGDIDALLERAQREPDGSYRVVASKALPGKPIGRIRFRDTRPDDPNDIVAHEDRRELRGYGVVAAWLNHVDAKAINSLDTLVTENGHTFVRHHIIDFGSALGSGGVSAADPWEGTQYLFEPKAVGKQLIGFGFSYPRWHTDKFYESPAVGRIPADNTSFDPELWRPRVPNQAFLQARGDDKFWAARRIMAFSSDMLRAAVKAGDFGNPEAEAVLVRALAERRDAIGRAYLTAVNPVVDPALGDDNVLTFHNAAVDADVAKAPQGYRAMFYTFDNVTQKSTWLGESVGPTTELEAPRRLPCSPGSFVKVQVSALGGSYDAWATPVTAYFRNVDGGWRLVGFERQP